MGRSVRTLLPGGLAALLVWGTACGPRSAEERGPVVVLRRAARDSMNAAFARSNEHWNELADLNTMERMLGTIRPTQREYLGCLQGQVNGEAVEIDGWEPARDMKQLQWPWPEAATPFPGWSAPGTAIRFGPTCGIFP
jgi:hypothetical protein